MWATPQRSVRISTGSIAPGTLIASAPPRADRAEVSSARDRSRPGAGGDRLRMRLSLRLTGSLVRSIPGSDVGGRRPVSAACEPLVDDLVAHDHARRANVLDALGIAGSTRAVSREMEDLSLEELPHGHAA